MTIEERVAARYAALRDVRPYTWKGSVATFDVDGVIFEMAFKGRSINHPVHGRVSGFDASFYKKADKGAPWMYKPTGEGKAMAILGTALAILRDFLQRQKPPFVWFVGDEASRVRLYDALMRRHKVPDYAAEITAEGVYTLRRTKGYFE